MTIINFPNYYDKIVVLCYPRGSGGKILMSCLSLNNHTVFQHRRLAKLQLQGKFTYKDKIDYLRQQLDLSIKDKIWTDMGISAKQLFNFITRDYSYEYPEFLSHVMSPVVKEIIAQDLNIVTGSHSTLGLQDFLKFWPNAKVIIFKNYRNFMDFRLKEVRTSLVYEYWNRIKAPQWPEHPPVNLTELGNLPKHVFDDLEQRFDMVEIIEEQTKLNDLEQLSYDLFDALIPGHVESLGPRCFLWDVDNSYKNNQIFLENFKKCQDWLGLPPVNDSDILAHFDHWARAIEISEVQW